MRLHTVIGVVAVAASFSASVAFAQSQIPGYVSPTVGAAPLTSNPASHINGSGQSRASARQFDTGLLVSADARTRAAAYAALPGVERAVAVAMDGDEAVQLQALRVGRYVTPEATALVICGVADQADKQVRFLARPTVATLETEANRKAFETGWRRAGCNG